MPITPTGLVSVLVPSLLSGGNIGTGMPRLAQGIANGVSLWIAQTTVSITGTGAAGAGAVSYPLVVPPPLIIANMLGGFSSAGIIGIMAAPLALSIANGLVTGFAQGLIVAAFPGVGSGVGVARVSGPPPMESMNAGFASAGLSGDGSQRIARGISLGLSQTFASLLVPVPIVGPSGPSPGAGTALGKIA